MERTRQICSSFKLIKNPTGSIFNKSFIVNELNNEYSPPTLKSIDSDSGSFANSGPRNHKYFRWI